MGTASANVLHVNADGTSFYTNTVQCSGSGTPSCSAVPISFTTPDQRIYLTFYGTGFRQRSSLSGITVEAGGIVLPVLYAGAQPVYPGLDQLNVELPRSLIGASTITVQLTVDGQAANPVTLAVQ